MHGSVYWVCCSLYGHLSVAQLLAGLVLESSLLQKYKPGW
ncbi:hypothetical protein EV682_101468 [Iodobacter fluviatilis]|uniref:Uncharacterized protein n=1 Tax=Iodobacter fluviatilis TaxID=537 RepID=A0A377Q3U4_9NEIS|nr:hypothetical protein EV682_101468 [Iodobacter fluviatilis]STQ89462.1 Uncharacterised protein [Iodobacter fluviatilis]